MSALVAPREIAVVVQDEEVARRLPRAAGLRRFTRASDDLLENCREVFVAVPLLRLPALAGFIRQANNKHYLRQLFVRDEHHSELLPQLLAQANLRTLRNLMVHSGPQLPARVLNAYVRRAEDELIADARLIEDHLFVITCAGQILELVAGQVPAVKDLDRQTLAAFELADDGSYLHWPAADIHLDLESIRALLDPQLRERQQLERLQNDRLFGKAVMVLRREQGLRQSDMQGLSERQVRRIEQGQRARMTSLRHLAQAHGMPVNEYLGWVAETVQTLREDPLAQLARAAMGTGDNGGSNRR